MAEDIRNREFPARDRDNALPRRSDLEGFLRDLGADEGVIAVCARTDDKDVQRLVSRFRTFARKNPAVVLGALSAVILGSAVAVERATTRKKKAKVRTKPASRKAATRTKKARSSSSKRTLIEPHPGDKRYVRRDAKGRIKESVDVGRSLAADRRRKSKRRAKAGEGDKGDR